MEDVLLTVLSLATWRTELETPTLRCVHSARLIGGPLADRFFVSQWATRGQGVGAYITLTWPSAIDIVQLVLFDRPNLADQVTGGNLTFAPGGQVVTFGELANNGAPVFVNLPSITTATSVTLLVTSVSSSTGNVGLAEIMVFGAVGR